MTSVGTIKVDFGGDASGVEKAFEKMRQALGKTEAATEKMQRALLKTDHASLIVDNFGNRLKKAGDDGAAALQVVIEVLHLLCWEVLEAKVDSGGWRGGNGSEGRQGEELSGRQGKVGWVGLRGWWITGLADLLEGWLGV
jgi:hypothetical protein